MLATSAATDEKLKAKAKFDDDRGAGATFEPRKGSASVKPEPTTREGIP